MGTTFSELICAMSEVKGMIKNMKNEGLTFFFILIAGLLTSCSMPNAVESTVSVDNESSKKMENEKPGTVFKDKLTFKVISISGDGLVDPNKQP